MSIPRKSVGRIADQIAILSHLSELANDRVEKDLDIGRATSIDGERVTLRFQRDGIETTQWVIAEINHRIKRLDKQMLEILNDQASAARVA